MSKETREAIDIRIAEKISSLSDEEYEEFLRRLSEEAKKSVPNVSLKTL